MGNKTSLLFILIVFIMAFASSSIVFNDLGPSLNDGETFVGFFEADLVNHLTKDDFDIYSGRAKVKFEKGIFSFGNKTFFYVVFSEAGNFTIQSKEFLYMENEVLKQGQLNYSVYVGPKLNNSLTISPGIVYGNNLSVVLKNVGDNNLSVNLQGDSLEIQKDSSNRSVIVPESNFFYLSIDTYKTFKIPIFYFNGSQQGGNVSEDNQTFTNDSLMNETFFRLGKSYLDANLTRNNSFNFEIFIFNLMNESLILNVESDSKYLEFNDSIEINGSGSYLFSFDFFSENAGSYKNNMTFSYKDFNENLSLNFLILEDEKDFDSFFDDGVGEDLNCSQMDGELCSELCFGGKIVPSSGGICCVGGVCRPHDYVEEPKKNYFVGILAFVIAGILGFIVYKKFKGVKPLSKF